jgi:hypothetical protein
VRKRWFLVLLTLALIIALIIETSILIVLTIQTNSGRQGFPGLLAHRYIGIGCSTLSGNTVAQTADNRTIDFSCSGAPAIRMVPTLSFPGFSSRDAPIVSAFPYFALPTGFLKLYLIDHNSSCNSLQYASTLVSGEPVWLGGSTWSYEYCAIIQNSARTTGFNIEWSPGELPVVHPAPFTLLASPSSMTIAAGEVAHLTVIVTSVAGWHGNVSFSTGMTTVKSSGVGEGPTTWNYTRISLTVGNGGSNSTVLNIFTKRCTGDGSYCAGPSTNRVDVWATTNDCLVKRGGSCFEGYESAVVSAELIIT